MGITLLFFGNVKCGALTVLPGRGASSLAEPVINFRVGVVTALEVVVVAVVVMRWGLEGAMLMILLKMLIEASVIVITVVLGSVIMLYILLRGFHINVCLCTGPQGLLYGPRYRVPHTVHLTYDSNLRLQPERCTPSHCFLE